MFFVGIDVSKYKHDCAIIDESGKVITPSFTFRNDAHGFETLLNALSKFEKESIEIGFEATGHYGCNLQNFLQKNGYSFTEINPVLVHNFSKQKTLRRTKTDSCDAKIIARYLLQEGINASSSALGFNELKALCRFRLCLTKQKKLYLLRLTNILDRIFPEFKPFFKDKFTQTALYILNHYDSVHAIAHMNSRSFDVLRRISHGAFSMDHFIKLKFLAKNTVGIQSEALQMELRMILDLHADIMTKIEDVELRIKKRIEELQPPILSIRGMGALSAAIIITEYGDIRRFHSANAMLSYAGLEPSILQSGTSCYSSHLVKHGSSYLRFALMNSCVTLRLHNEVFASYYLKKVSEGKHHTVAMTHLAKKLVRLIYTLETKGILFDASIQR